MRKIKIFYTIPNFKTAGSQYVLLSLFERIDRSIFDPFICIENYPELIPESIPADHRLFFRWSGRKLRDIWSFRGLLKKYSIDIVHSWDYKSNYFEAVATRAAGVRYLYTKKNNAWSKRWLVKSYLSSHIVYNNPDMNMRFFDSRLFNNRVSFIPHGVDTEIFRPLETTNHKDFNLVCIGNIGANKNQLFLLKALTQLPKNIVLHLYGKEEVNYRKQMDGYSIENGLDSRVFFNGFVENKNIPEVLKSMDIFVLPSNSEGLPVSIMEAMACGVPVLSSDSGGGTRCLLDEENIFSLNGTNELIEKIEYLHSLERSKKETMKEEGIKKVLQKYSIEREVLSYEMLYKKLV